MEQNRDFQGQCSPLLSWLLNSCFPASVNTSLQGRECFGSSSNFLGEWPGGCCHHQGSLDLCTDLCQQSCWVFSLLFCILFFFPQMFSVLQLLTKLVYLFVCAGLACCLSFSLVATKGGYTLAVVCGFLIAVASFVKQGLLST